MTFRAVQEELIPVCVRLLNHFRTDGKLAISVSISFFVGFYEQTEHKLSYTERYSGQFIRTGTKAQDHGKDLKKRGLPFRKLIFELNG
jgi:hypothetical protein